MFNYGIIGTGMIASIMAGAIAKAEGISVCGVASRSHDRAVRFARIHGIAGAPQSHEALIADPAVDAIYLAVPNEFHAEIARKAMIAGKPVLCEKPLAPDFSTARAMVSLAQQHGVALREAFAFRHMPATDAIAGLLSEGGLGEPRLIRMNMTYVRQSAPGISPGGGALLDSGCYAVCMGQMVFRHAARRAWANAVTAASGLDVVSLGVVEYQEGQQLQLSCATILPDHDHVEIFCSNGIIMAPILNRSLPGTAVHIKVKRGAGRDAPIEMIKTACNDGYAQEAIAFARLVMGEADDYRMGLQDSLHVAAALDALQQSRKSGRWESVSSL